jgi:DNA-binding YbaB/EbfC family protein
MSELMRQAQRMQRKIEKISSDMKSREWTAKVAGDKVAATVTGERKVTSIVVDDEFWKGEERDVVLDAIAAAINAAQSIADKEMEAAINAATGGLKIPGLNG